MGLYLDVIGCDVIEQSSVTLPDEVRGALDVTLELHTVTNNYGCAEGTQSRIQEDLGDAWTTKQIIIIIIV